MAHQVKRVGDWLRAWPVVRWSWPTPVLRARRRSERTDSQPAAVHARRLTDPLGDDVEIRNDGAGEALDVVVQAYAVEAPNRAHLREGRVAFLGARTTYVVGLGVSEATDAELPAGYWVHVQWLNRDGSHGESWSRRAGGTSALALEPSSAPLEETNAVGGIDPPLAIEHGFRTRRTRISPAAGDLQVLRASALLIMTRRPAARRGPWRTGIGAAEFTELHSSRIAPIATENACRVPKPHPASACFDTPRP